MKRLTHAAHLSVSSHAPKVAEHRTRSTPSSRGTGGRRHPVSPQGFEAIPGYRPNRVARGISPRRHISELTYGPPAPTLHTGTRAGAQVPIKNTRIYPWRATAALHIAVPGKAETFYGTGWFIGPSAVITAAHVVYPRELGGYVGWVDRIEVIPGQNGPGKPPYGSFPSNNFHCPAAWPSDGDLRADYAVVVLEEPIGDRLGWFGYTSSADDELLSAMANLAGYPLINPDGSGADGRQWYGAGDIYSADESFIYYHLGTRDGESGSCVYRNVEDDSLAMAIHTAATGAADRGLRIIEPVYDNLQQWSLLKG